MFKLYYFLHSCPQPQRIAPWYVINQLQYVLRRREKQADRLRGLQTLSVICKKERGRTELTILDVHKTSDDHSAGLEDSVSQLLSMTYSCHNLAPKRAI